MLDLSAHIARGSGLFSKYYTLNETTGIKVIGANHDRDEGTKFLSLKEMKEVPEYFQRVKREYLLLKKLEVSGRTPKPYRLRIVKIQKYYFVGIEMEHISGKELGETRFISKCKALDLLNGAMKKLGCYHGDLHDGNAILSDSGKIFMIDLSPSFIYPIDQKGKVHYGKSPLDVEGVDE